MAAAWNAGGQFAVDMNVMTLPTVDGLRFVTVGQDDALAEPLMAELAVEYSTRYGGTPATVTSWLRSFPAAQFAAPTGGMLIGLVGGTPVTGGAFCRFDERTAELKRIWTDSGHRRRGLARVLLVELEAAIVERGYRRVYLTTGDRQPEAEALYLAAGYTRLTEPLPADGDVYPIAFAKELQP
jgi:GNAT superfamily N-acetyltransferase